MEVGVEGELSEIEVEEASRWRGRGRSSGSDCSPRMHLEADFRFP